MVLAQDADKLSDSNYSFTYYDSFIQNLRTCNRLFQIFLKKFIKNRMCYISGTAVFSISKMKIFWYNLQMRNHTVKLI